LSRDVAKTLVPQWIITGTPRRQARPLHSGSPQSQVQQRTGGDDVAEVGGTREVLRGLLSGVGYPFLMLRISVAEPSVGVPSTPRRPPADVIDIDID
jgi:hypothetical protein